MSISDPVSDLLSRIRNAIASKHESLEVPASKLKVEIVRILKEEGYIANYAMEPDHKQGTIRIQLRYGPAKRAVISSLSPVSRPGCRVYAAKNEIPSILGGMGVCILSTSHGILTGKQAQEKGVGGEVLCSVS